MLIDKITSEGLRLRFLFLSISASALDFYRIFDSIFFALNLVRSKMDAFEFWVGFRLPIFRS